MTGISMASGNFVIIVAKITIIIEKNPIQFCLYGATTSSRSFSFEIVPSIAFCEYGNEQAGQVNDIPI